MENYSCFLPEREEMQIDEVWPQAVNELQLNVSQSLFDFYVRKLKPIYIKEEIGGGVHVELSCQSVWHQREIEKRLKSPIVDVLQGILKRPVELGIIVDTSVEPESFDNPDSLFSEQSVPRSENDVKEKITKSGLSADLSLESFAVSSSNEMAYAAAKAVAANPGKAYNPLFLYGGVGVGKTHLMQGVGQEILKKNDGLEMIYCSGEDFTNEIIDAIRRKSTPRFRKRYRQVDLLLIDDIQFIAGKASVQEEFFHTFNAITREGGQIIMTSDKPPKDIDSLEERLRSRFEGGLTIDIGLPDFELRSAILMIKAKQLKIDLSTDVAQVIATKETNTRSLLGILKKVVAFSVARNTEISVEIAMKVIGQEREDEEMMLKNLSPEKVVDLVCGYFSQDKLAVLGKSRVKQLTLPRHVAMFLLKEDFGLGYVEIGRLFGGRDHTSVMHAVKKVHLLVKAKKEVGGDVDQIRKSFNN